MKLSLITIVVNGEGILQQMHYKAVPGLGCAIQTQQMCCKKSLVSQLFNENSGVNIHDRIEKYICLH